MTDSILSTFMLTKRFGGLTAVSKVEIEVERNTIHAIIGPNGSGKTTFFNIISGMYLPNEGKIMFDGTDITGWPSYKIAHRGMGRTFQTICLFQQMTALENVRVGGQCHSNYSLLSNLLSKKKTTKANQLNIEKADALLDFFDLTDQRNHIAISLPYGKQKLLEIARAMAMNPKLILLDEPAAGMNPAETVELIKKIREIRDRFNITVLIIEHNMQLVMNIADEITCLDYGAKISCGLPNHVASDERVVEAYLGAKRISRLD